MNNFKKVMQKRKEIEDLVSVDIEKELKIPYGGMSDIIKQLAEARAKAIDDKIREFGITEENAKDYHIDIQGNKYIISKKVKIGEFTI